MSLVLAEHGASEMQVGVDQVPVAVEAIGANTAAPKSNRREEEEYVVLTEQGPPISMMNTRERGGSDDFCEKLDRMARTLEELAHQRTDHNPSDALALLLQALGLLKKALNVSMGEASHQSLWKAFQRMLAFAETVAETITRREGDSEIWRIRARPNHVIFNFAVQCAVESTAALAHGKPRDSYHEKMKLALLLLDLLGSEAEGEDLATISSLTEPLKKLITGIESVDPASKRVRGDAGVANSSSLTDASGAPCLSGCT